MRAAPVAPRGTSPPPALAVPPKTGCAPPAPSPGEVVVLITGEALALTAGEALVLVVAEALVLVVGEALVLVVGDALVTTPLLSLVLRNWP